MGGGCSTVLEKVRRVEPERAKGEKAQTQLGDMRGVRGSPDKNPETASAATRQAVGSLPHPASRCSDPRGGWGQLPY